MNDLTLIIPAKYEKESLPKVLDELKKFDVKKNIVLEKSDKSTVEAISNYDCKIIYQDSVGYGDALKKGIETAIHYPIPIHLQSAGKSLGYKKGSFPVAESQSSKILTLPINQYLSKQDIIKICKIVNKFYE